tara:strand:+ start:2064 stop:2504 length:441 start_codon:yes stop_codon:yes gene_type:complete
MLYSFKNQYPQSLPERIRLSDGSTRTDSSTFTEDELTDAGYVSAGEQPAYDSSTHKLTWNGSSWEVVELTESEIAAIQKQLWDEVRHHRNIKIEEVEWRIFRNLSETRIGITTTTDDLGELDAYMQALRDITNSSDPLSITWPDVP